MKDSLWPRRRDRRPSERRSARHRKTPASCCLPSAGANHGRYRRRCSANPSELTRPCAIAKSADVGTAPYGFWRRDSSYGSGTGGCRAGMQGREPGAAPVRAWRDRSFPSASANAWKLGYFSYGLSRCRCGCGVKTGPVGPDPGAQTGAPRNVAGPAAADRTVRSRFLPAGSPPSCSPTPHKVAGGK